MGTSEFNDLSTRLRSVDPQEYAQAIQDLIFNNVPWAAEKCTTRRSLIQWEVPHLGQGQTIEMYINPQNLQFSSRKEINRVRAKGGYIAQYWGEDLDTINISGTTGSSGIEGVNALRDVYRSEQLALVRIIKNSAGDKRRQSLMQLAASVIMWYQGQGYRGFFTDMSYTESVNQLGLFEYTMTFSVVEYLGNRRRNFLPWHRHPWSTTNTPNLEKNQSRSGGGYTEGEKIGILNVPRFKLELRHLTDKEGNSKGVKQVAILKPDPKDIEASRFDNQQIQNDLNRKIPR